jgi:hypothetical protein
MPNLVAQSNFRDPKDILAEVRDRSLTMTEVLTRLGCDFKIYWPRAPRGFRKVDQAWFDLATLKATDTRRRHAKSHLTGRPDQLSGAWTELRYIDESKTRAVMFPNYKSNSDRVMLFAPGATLNGVETRVIVSAEIEGRDQYHPGFVAGIYRYSAGHCLIAGGQCLSTRKDHPCKFEEWDEGDDGGGERCCCTGCN